MDTSANNNNSSINPSEETNMSTIHQLFNEFIAAGGQPKVTEFKRFFDKLVKDEIKPLCGRSGRTASGDDWRSELKSRFSGRGAKWVLVPLAEINPTITHFESEGMDCDDYKTFIEAKGGAWIRFSGPRLNAGKPAAAFEVRISGSTIDHPRHLHMIDLELLEETIRPLGGTPHSLKLEEVAKAAPVEEPEVEAEPIEEDVTPLSNDELNFDDEFEAYDEDAFDDDEDFDAAF